YPCKPGIAHRPEGWLSRPVSRNVGTAVLGGCYRKGPGSNRRIAMRATGRERTTQSKMKRTLLLATAALGALTISVNARDDRLPAKFVGNWCLAEETIYHSIVAVAVRIPTT